MKNHFFPSQAIPTTFGFTLSLHWWYSIPRSVWFGQLLNPKPDEKKPIFKTPFSKKFAKFRTKTQFFSDASSTSFFALHCQYTGDTQYRVWFDLDNSLTRWSGTFLKFSKIRNSRNSQYSVWKPKFFLGTLYQKFFALHSHYTGDTQYRVWFDLDNSLTRWKRFFLKTLKISQFAKFAKFRMKNYFFLAKLYQQLLALHCHYIGDNPYRVWFDLDNSLTRWKKPIFKIPFSRNSQNSVRKPTFFPRQALTFFALHCHYTGDTQYRVWFDLDNSLTQWKWFFINSQNFAIREIRKIPYENSFFS